MSEDLDNLLKEIQEKFKNLDQTDEELGYYLGFLDGSYFTYRIARLLTEKTEKKEHKNAKG